MSKMNLVEREVSFRVKGLDGRSVHPIRYNTKTVLLIDQPYGRERREAQAKLREENNEKWRAMTPQQQLKELDRRLGYGLGAMKQRNRINAQIAELEKEAAKKQKNKEKFEKNKKK